MAKNVKGAIVPVHSEVLRKMANYVVATKPLLEKLAKQESALSQGAPGVVDILARNGLMHEHLKEAQARKFVEDPSTILTALGDVAGHAKIAVGSPAGDEANLNSNQGETSDDIFVRGLTH